MMVGLLGAFWGLSALNQGWIVVFEGRMNFWRQEKGRGKGLHYTFSGELLLRNSYKIFFFFLNDVEPH